MTIRVPACWSLAAWRLQLIPDQATTSSCYVAESILLPESSENLLGTNHLVDQLVADKNNEEYGEYKKKS